MSGVKHGCMRSGFERVEHAYTVVHKGVHVSAQEQAERVECVRACGAMWSVQSCRTTLTMRSAMDSVYTLAVCGFPWRKQIARER